jgi:hypothetical protein
MKQSEHQMWDNDPHPLINAMTAAERAAIQLETFQRLKNLGVKPESVRDATARKAYAEWLEKNP